MSAQFKKRKRNQSGFIIADFLFSFVLVIGVGIFIFALTFSLATIEISQYIVWSSARAYSSGNIDEAAASLAATKKFKSLSAQFPLLTGEGSPSPWYRLENFKAQNHETEATFVGKVSGPDLQNRDGNTERRQPWTGASADIYLKLFASIGIPFFGKVSSDPEKDFSFRVYAFIIRNPSYFECTEFFKVRFEEIQKLDTFDKLGTDNKNYLVEDNGC